MLLVWSESCTREALDQVIAIRGELSRNVLAAVSMIPGNDAITYPHLARYYVVPVTIPTVLNIEPPPVAGSFIAVNSTKGNISFAADGNDDAAAEARCRIVRNGAVDEGELAAIEDAAAVAILSRDRIAGDSAVG